MMKRTILCSLIAVMGLAQLGTACEEYPMGVWNGTFISDTYGPNGTITDWIVRADSTTEGHWELDAGFTVISFNPSGNYTYDNCVFEFSCSGTAYESGSGTTSGYTLYVKNGNVTGDNATGDYEIFFSNIYWPPFDSGTWSVTREPATITKHVYAIFIESGINYDEPDETEICYEFDFEIGTDDTVDLISVTTPGTPGVAGGITFEIPNLADQWDDVNQIWTNYEYYPGGNTYCWEYGKNAAMPGELDCYGDGWYDVTVFYNGGDSNSTKIWFSVPADTIPIPQPTQRPLFTNVTNRQRLDSPVTLEWVPCEDSNASTIWIDFGKMLGDEEIETSLPKTDTSYGPVDLNDGYWEVDILFDNYYELGHNADGIPYGLAKCSESEYMLGVGILAEITNDDIVNFEDFAKLAQGWLDQDCGDWNLYCNRADLNFDNKVDYDDLLIISEDWLAQPLSP